MKKNPILNLLSYTWRYSLGNRKWFIVFCVMSFVANIIVLFQPIVIGRAFNSAQTTSSDPKFLTLLITNLFFYILLEVGFWIFHGTARVIEERNAFLVRRNYKLAMIRKVLELPIKWQKDHHSGDTIDKISKGGQYLFDFSSTSFMIIENAVRLFGSMAMLLFFYWPAAVISFLVSIVAIFSILLFDRRLRKGYRKVFKAENYLSAGIYDYIGNIITVITLRLEKRAQKEIGRRTLLGFPVFRKNTALNEIKWFVVSIFISLMTAGIIVMNAVTSFRKDGLILVGTLFILYRYLASMGEAFYAFAWKYGEIVVQDSALRATEVITKDFRESKKLKTPSASLPNDWQTIKIAKLFFAYPKDNPLNEETKEVEEKCNISNVSLCISKGKKIALIGESGSGKSTVLSLLRGLYLPNKVSVYCAGKKLPNGLAHFYSQTALIPQDPELFNATVKENIVMGGDPQKERLSKVIRLAEFQKTIKKLSHGLATNVMERGVSLSGGEKQRLALARGLYFSSKKDILLLDEPTSSVDNENETAIYKNIFKEYPQKTVISSIHRLHLLPMFDYIYFFKNGEVIAEGTLLTLLEDENFKILWRKYGKGKESDCPRTSL